MKIQVCVYDITPVSAPRMTGRDKWLQPPRPAVAKYNAFKRECKLKKVFLPEGGSKITFVLPFPKSYSKKKCKALDGKPYQVKARNDLDNLFKALMDAIFDDDSHIWQINGLKKIWGYEGQIIIEIDD